MTLDAKLPTIYTHCWCPSGVRIFSAGGPGFFSLRGCYMATWS